MSVTLDTRTEFDQTGTGTSMGGTHVVSASAQIIIVRMAIRNGGNLATAINSDIDGAFTKQVDSSGNTSTSIWVLENPTAGSHQITATLTNSDRPKKMVVDSWSGLDATPIGNTNTGSGADALSYSTTITSTSGNLILDVFCTPDADPAGTITPDASQDVHFAGRVGGTFDGLMAMTGEVATGASTVMSGVTTDQSGGWNQAVIELVAGTVTPTAPSVTTEAASAIGDTTATLNGTVTSDGNATITERGFYYSTSPSVTTADTKVTTAGTTGAYTFNLTGLTQSTTYYYRAFATNSEGTTLGSSDVSFTTNATATAPDAFLVGDWAIADLGTGGDARITITTLPADNGSAITDLEVKIGAAAYASLGGTTTGTYDLNDQFTDGVATDVLIRAVNSVGNGPDSDTKSVTTSAPPPFSPADTDVLYLLDVSDTTNSPTGELRPVELSVLKTYFNAP